ncbi:hypothetical protein BDZ89DRAFT_1200381 [Hymenopellis radicata]|nr:hypothetical protein BDZ89DRAFT_1200381 [Hymenopellis radicata]
MQALPIGPMPLSVSSTGMWADPSASNGPAHSPSDLSHLRNLLEPYYPLARNPLFSVPLPTTSSSPSLNKYRRCYSKLIMHMQSMSDKKIPWRDLAVSRQCILAENGPFSPTNLYTQSGLFSALIYRGITHNSSFLSTERKIFFHDWNHWNDIYLDARQRHNLDNTLSDNEVDMYFADGCAYGSWTRRHPAAAVDYWTAVQKAELTDWLLKKEKPAFGWLYRLFKKGRVAISGIGKRKRKTKAFPGLGALQGYLLAADYAIAGAAEFPTPLEMGELLIGDLQTAGAMKGLRRLGIEPTTAAEAAVAFFEVHDYIKNLIPEVLQERMNFNLFTTEHILCKEFRLNIKLFKDLQLVWNQLPAREKRVVYEEWLTYWE